MSLTIEQQQAVEADPNSKVVLEAVPGSGKTTVISHRIEFLLNSGVEPENILVCTFSRSQSEDMAKRIFAHLSKSFPYIETTALANGFGAGIGQITTIHATARRMLLYYDDEFKNRRVVPNWKERSIIEKAVEDLNWTYYSYEGEKPVGYKSILIYINNAKYHLVDFTYDALRSYYQQTPITEEDIHNLILVSLRYQKEMLADGSWSFADMLYECERKLKNDLKFRTYWHNRFTHIIVDEAQDTNGQAMRIITLLDPESLFITGDSDQCLYRFNHASPEINLRDGFDRRYPSGIRLNMSYNFRSHPVLLERAAKLIRYNYEGERAVYAKALKAHNAMEGPDITYQQYLGPEEEAKAIIDSITDPGRTMIMSRTNAQLAYYELELFKHKIPFINLGGSSFFSRTVPAMVAHFVRFIVDHTDGEAFDQIHNVSSKYMRDRKGKYIPTRYLGRKFTERLDYSKDLYQQALLHRYDEDARGWARWKDGINDLERAVREIGQWNKGDSAGRLVEKIVEVVLDKWIEHEYDAGEDAADNYREDLAIVSSLAHSFTVEEFIDFVRSLQEAQNVKPEDVQDILLLGTIYRFKGLERDIVYIIGATQGLLPHRFSLGEPPPTDGLILPSTGDIYDERNLMYVAVTRAKQECHISSVMIWPTIKSDEYLQPSQFIYEMELI